ncbi:response regulator transcription factor [bacterium]|nr:response regulator transcription factor [bacterium]
MVDKRNQSSTQSPCRVGVIEDQKHLRESLVSLINATDGFRIAGSFETMEEALRSIEKDFPHIVLTDIGLPGMTGIQGIRILKDRYPRLLFLVLTVHEDDERIFEALCAGATGYLLKNISNERLIQSLHEAAEGGAPMSPEVARRVINLFQKFRPPKKADYDLTPHEHRILKMLVEGHNYKTAAKELSVSINTVSFHVKKIYDKLQVHSKSEAVSKAFRDGIV